MLVVDDERLSRTVVSSLLRKCCYKVTVVDSGVVALETLKSSRPGTYNLVLTDLMMPDVDGLDLLRYVREDENLRSVPVVMMSASERSESMRECIKDGAEDYLLKPLARKEVEYIWQHVWRRRQSAGVVPRLEEEEYYEEAAEKHLGMDGVPFPAEQPGAVSTAPVFAAFHSSDIRVGGVAVTAAAEELADLQAGHVSRPPQPGAQQLRQADSRPAGSLGGSVLGAWLGRRPQLDARRAFDLLCRLISLLRVYHLQGKPFGRMRPSQVLVTPAGGLNEVQPGSSPVPPAEQACYSSPEEAAGAPPSLAGDVFSLGMLAFELFYTAGMADDVKRAALCRVRSGCLPDAVQRKPEEAAFLRSVLAREPSNRPKLMDVIYSDTLPKLLASLASPTFSAPASLQARPPRLMRVSVPKTLLAVLDMFRARAAAEAAAIRRELTLLDADLAHARCCSSALAGRQCAASGAQLDQQQQLGGGISSMELCSDDSSFEAPAKRARLDMGDPAATTAAGPGMLGGSSAADRFRSLAPVLPQLEQVFGQRRRQAAAGAADVACLASFCQDLRRFSRYSRLAPRASVKCVDLQNTNDLVCSIAFDRDDEYFATAGVSRKLKVFDFNSVLDSEVPMHYPVLEINTRSKLSCVCWNPYLKSNIICSDYDGTIQLWDAKTKTELTQFDEHARRVWSVDFAPTNPRLFLSGSDDHAVKLWALNCESSVATLDAKANVCSVQFHPTDSNVFACGAANYRVYLYDLRSTGVPLAVLGGHHKAVSYVRFLGSDRLVTAATDHQLRQWDLPAAYAAGRCSEPALVYRGHVNEKNFVGLSISNDGYIACGSEENAAYVYESNLPMPLTRYSFSGEEASGGGPAGAPGDGGLYNHFVSSVAWSQRSRYLTVANSTGVLKVLETC